MAPGRAVVLAAGLVGCGHAGLAPARVGSPQPVPGAVMVDSVQGGDRTAMVQLSVGGARTQSIVHRWTAADVTEYDVVLDRGGQLAAEARVMPRAGQSAAIFTHLRLGVAYTVAATALGNTGPDPSAPATLLDADHPATASVAFSGSNDVNDETTVDLAIQLDDMPFSGTATTSFDTTDGSYTAPGGAETGVATQDTNGVTTVAGSVAGYLDGAANIARLDAPHGLAIDASGDIFVSDSGNGRIREISPTGRVSTLGVYDPTGSRVPSRSAVSLGLLDGITLDPTGDIYLAQSLAGVVTALSMDASASSLAGDGQVGLVDGADASASFDMPADVATAPGGTLLVSDTLDNCIRAVDPNGYVYTWLGSGVAGSADGYGLAAEFDHPAGMGFDEAGDLYVADAANDTIRKVTPGGDVSTYAGSPGRFGDADGPAPVARFDGPTGIAVASDGTVYVADTNNNTIRAISPSGIVSTLAGSGYSGFADGPLATAEFDGPSGLALDGHGHLLVADTLNNRIREVSLK